MNEPQYDIQSTFKIISELVKDNNCPFTIKINLQHNPSGSYSKDSYIPFKLSFLIRKPAINFFTKLPNEFMIQQGYEGYWCKVVDDTFVESIKQSKTHLKIVLKNVSISSELIDGIWIGDITLNIKQS